MKKLLIIGVILVLVATYALNNKNSSVKVSSEKELKKAIENKSIKTIEIVKDINLNEKIDINRDINILTKDKDKKLWEKDKMLESNLLSINITDDFSDRELFNIKDGNVKIRGIKLNGNSRTSLINVSKDCDDFSIYNSILLNGDGTINSPINIENKNNLISECLIANNKTYGKNNSGGAINYKDKGSIEKTYFINNKSLEYGGAISFNNSINITRSYFVGNSSNYGGALSKENGNKNKNKLNIESTKFIDNGSYNGGAIYLKDNLDGEISKSRFENNFADKKGGAISLKDFSGNLEIKESIFLKNKSEFGGALNLYQDSSNKYYGNVEIENIIAKENTGEFGGVINQEGKINLTIKDGKYEKNEADYGGVINSNINKLNNNTLKINENAEFIENKAKRVAAFLNICTMYYNKNSNKYELDHEENIYKKVYIDDNIIVKNNDLINENRKISGFEENKYKKYENSLKTNIKLKTSSFKESPFNNVDINMLGYEYYLLVEDKNNRKYREVFRGEDKLKLDEDFSIKRMDEYGETIQNQWEKQIININYNDIELKK